jgi:hypothetical protein
MSSETQITHQQNYRSWNALSSTLFWNTCMTYPFYPYSLYMIITFCCALFGCLDFRCACIVAKPSNFMRSLFNHVGTRSPRSNLKMEAGNCTETLLLFCQSTWPIIVSLKQTCENCHRPDTSLYVAVGKAARRLRKEHWHSTTKYNLKCRLSITKQRDSWWRREITWV